MWYTYMMILLVTFLWQGQNKEKKVYFDLEFAELSFNSWLVQGEAEWQTGVAEKIVHGQARSSRQTLFSLFIPFRQQIY